MPALSVQRPVDFTWLVPLVLVVHGAIGWAILQNRTEPLPASPKVMEVSISLSPAQQPAPARSEPPRPTPPPQPKAQPQPQPKRTPTPAPVAKAPAPAPVALPAVAPVTDAPVTPPAEPAPPAPPAPAPAPEPAPIVPPSFSAAYLENPAPAYPSASRRLGETGRVLLRVRVNPEGHAEAVELATSCGFERLDRAAMEAVKRWRFVPARQAGAPVTAWVKVPLSFNLDS